MKWTYRWTWTRSNDKLFMKEKMRPKFENSILPEEPGQTPLLEVVRVANKALQREPFVSMTPNEKKFLYFKII
jgi:hypothetical protein